MGALYTLVPVIWLKGTPIGLLAPSSWYIHTKFSDSESCRYGSLEPGVEERGVIELLRNRTRLL